MRYSKDHKQESRSRIIRSAAREIRSRGPDKISVAAVMASSGLTHGAFYAHFSSKEGLVAEAIEEMFSDARRLGDTLENASLKDVSDARLAFRTYLAAYLSPEHRDGPERGCPLPSLATDMARTGGPAATQFAVGLAQLTSRIAVVLAKIGVRDPSAEANAIIAQMVGAIGLARAVGRGELSDAILRNSFSFLAERFEL